MVFSLRLPEGINFDLSSGLVYSIMIGVVVVIVLIILAIPVFRFYFKKNSAASEVEDETSRDSTTAMAKEATEDTGPIMNFITLIAFVGILAAIAIMAYFNIQQRGEIEKKLDDLRAEQGLTVPGDDRGEIVDPTLNVPPPGYSADRLLFPQTLSDRPNRPPASGPPPAISKEAVIEAGPILKTEPYQVYLSQLKQQSSFSVRNDGNMDLEFTLTPSNPNISVSPSSGLLKPSQELPITVNGTASGIIKVASNHLYDAVEVYFID